MSPADHNVSRAYRFEFVEHDNDGGPETRRRSVVLSGCPESFARAMVDTLRGEPFISDVKVTVMETTERVLPL